mmetsp:Transcript_53034/g.147651  ORF Transcript_53034/g.147651 Transcript_53034/m.147651 type:complete len:257 (-) Transcript_53034:525-1295(-)
MAATEQMAKKAKTGDESYYKVIDGVKYDRALLEAVESFAKDGQVGYPEAKQLWRDAEDGKDVTDIEKATLEYAMTAFKFSEKALAFMKTYVSVGKHTSYYQVIDGVKYERELLESAQKAAADGQVSWREAKELLEQASDGKGMTGTERNTLEYVLEKLKFTDKARAYLEKELKLPQPASYYKIIDGQKYDAALLLEVDDAVKDGVLSEAEALRLWDAAADGKGVTDIEKRTLQHVINSGKCSEAAKKTLESKFGPN